MKIPGLLSLIAALSAIAPLHGATRQWTGSGADDFWSDAANWLGNAPPADGDDAVFAANSTPGAELDYSLQLGSFTYASNAALTAIHVGAGSASTLTLSGTGIVNNTPFVSGQNLQDFFADASTGPTGGTLLFTNTASVIGSQATTLTASGASVAGGGGGTIIFQDHSSTANNRNFNGLIAAGATVAGAGGGTVILRGDALAQDTTQVVARAGVGAGAAGGQITIQDRARIESNVTVLQGESGGYGGRVDFYNSALLINGLLENFGSNSSLAGGEAVTRFFDNATFNGAAENYAGGGAGFAGGRMEFHGHAVFGDSLSTAQIINQGSYLSGAGSGRTLFFDDSSAALVGIFNEADGESNNAGSMGGVTEFHDRSHAGQATIINDGANASGAGSLGGRTTFFDSASAESANITNSPGYTAGAPGGVTVFAGNSTAGSATIAAYGVGVGLGGKILFQDNASGGLAQILTNAGGVFDISGLATAGTTVGSIDGGGSFLLGPKSLTVGGNGLSTDVSGTISGSGGSLTKVGAGTLTISGAGSYTGATSVSSGALFVDGTLGGSGVSVASGARLGGGGAISAPVNVASSGVFTPGSLAAPGTLTINDTLTLSAGSTTNFRLGAPGVVGGPLNDLLNVTGNVTLAGTLNITNSGAFGIGSYRLVNYSVGISNSWTLGAFPAGFSASDFAIQTGGGQVNLVIGGANILYWDGPQTVANGAVDGGSGTWNNSTTNWTNAAGTANTSWGSRFAMFSGTAGTVTVAEPVTVTAMQFTTSGYTVNATGSGVIQLSLGSTIRTDPGTVTTINAPLTGSGSLSKLDTGTLTLGGNSSYTGGTTIQDGLVIVTNVAGLGLGTGPVTLNATATAELDFIGNASAGNIALTNLGAPSTAVSAFAQFKDDSTGGAATIHNSGNTGAGGFGGQVNFINAATAGNATITNEGSAFAPPVGLFANNGAGVTLFANSATGGSATFLNNSSLAASALGGRIFFTDNSTAGASNITNTGGALGGGGAGSTFFSGTARAGTATITNLGSTASGPSGGLTEFAAGTTADAATFITMASGFANGAGGFVHFLGNSTAGSATFTQYGATAENAIIPAEGGVVFDATSSASASTFFNLGATASGAVGGAVFFDSTSTAGSASITNRGSAIAGALGGTAIFYDNSTAGSATITAEGGTAAGAGGGRIVFNDNSSAASATLVANAGTAGGTPGQILFSGSAGGGSSRIVLNGGTLDISGTGNPGITIGSLEGASGSVLLGSKLLSVGVTNTKTTYGGSITGSGILIKAGTGSLTLTGASTYSGGTSIFDGALTSTDPTGTAFGSGAITVQATPAAALQFLGAGSAGSLTITDTPGPTYYSGGTIFGGTATAAHSLIVNQATTVDGGTGGLLEFFGTSTAGQANIVNLASGAANAGGNGAAGHVFFFESSSAGNAGLTNIGGTAANASGGFIAFTGSATADTSLIDNRGGSAAGAKGGVTQFLDSSSAGTSIIHARGGQVASASNGQVAFENTSTAGSATLYADVSAIGAPGGSITFESASTGGNARAIVNGDGGLTSGGLDISQLTTPGMTIGSIEGGGIVSLGSKTLQVGSNNLAATFMGLIRDGGFVAGTGGKLDVQGSGSLRLTGANTYTGGTSIGDGVNPHSGKLIAANTTGSATGSGPVTVQNGGTLSGSGHVGGAVTLKPGGTIAPGDPVTLFLDDNLTWDGGSTIRLVIGPDQANSDLLSITGALLRGDPAGGAFAIDLVDGGLVVGETYDLIHFGSLDPAFAASEITITGAAKGALAFSGGALSLQITAVPEPAAWIWLALGMALLATTGGRRLGNSALTRL